MREHQLLSTILPFASSLLIACAPPNPSVGPSSKARYAAASPSSPVFGNAAVPSADAPSSACAVITDCTACASQRSCRWCTNPRVCTTEGASCTGLLLGHPKTCDNDPVERTRLMTERAEARTRGLTAVGPPVVGRLDSFPGVDFNLVRGHCYAVVVRFGKGARLGDVTENQRMSSREESASGGSMAQSSAPNAPQGLYCPRSPGTLTVWYEDRWSRARVTNAGQGEVSVQLYSVPISEADLRAGDAKSAALSRKIDSMPADCDDCDFNCRSSGTDCENRCFRDTQRASSYTRSQCEYTCRQITRSCQSACESRCR